MDENILELLNQSIAERAQIAFTQMRQIDPRIDAMVKDLVAFSEEVQHHAGIKTESKELVHRYLSNVAEVDSEFQKHMYIQGAKDCVVLLRELGVIK